VAILGQRFTRFKLNAAFVLRTIHK